MIEDWHVIKGFSSYDIRVIISIYLQFDDIWFSSLIHLFLQVDPRQFLICAMIF